MSVGRGGTGGGSSGRRRSKTRGCWVKVNVLFFTLKNEILGGPFFLLEVLSEMKGRPLQSPTCKARPLKEKP